MDKLDAPERTNQLGFNSNGYPPVEPSMMKHIVDVTGTPVEGVRSALSLFGPDELSIPTETTPVNEPLIVTVILKFKNLDTRGKLVTKMPSFVEFTVMLLPC